MCSETAIEHFSNPSNTRVNSEVGKLRPSLAAEVKEHGGAEPNRYSQCRSYGI